MPKMKTNKSASKRLKRTKTGKFKRFNAFARHKATHKPAKRRRRLRTATLIAAVDQQRVSRMLPNG